MMIDFTSKRNTLSCSPVAYTAKQHKLHGLQHKFVILALAGKKLLLATTLTLTTRLSVAPTKVLFPNTATLGQFSSQQGSLTLS